jgi:excisionase family DNA binding protein
LKNKKIIRDLTVDQIASRLAYSKVWIRRLAREKRIPSTKVGFGRGRKYMFNEEEVRKCLYNENNIGE